MSLPFESYVSGEYLVNNPTWDEEDSVWKAGQVLKAFRRNRLAPKTIVEVGCGAGGVLAELHGHLPDVVYSGFEIAPDASRFWEKHKLKNIAFEVNDFLRAGSAHYDCLLLLDVIEHIPDPFGFLRALRLRADHFVFHIPLDLSASSVLREKPLLYARSKVGHIQYFTKNLALSLFAECGFQVTDWFYTGVYLSARNKSWKSRLAVLPRYLAYMINRDAGVRLLGGETLMVIARV
jgi:hypothetical protein